MSTVREVTHPLFIPKGSVRACVTLLLASASCFQLIQGTKLGLALNTALFLVLTYYFAHRGGAGAPAGGEATAGSQPLWLPRGVIRTLLVLGIVGTGGWLTYKGQLFDDVNRITVISIGSFFAGVLLGSLYEFRKNNPNVKTPFLDLFDHMKALAVLCAAGFLGWSGAIGLEALADESTQVGALAVIAFYFGSR